jgi:hypothetical protein
MLRLLETLSPLRLINGERIDKINLFYWWLWLYVYKHGGFHCLQISHDAIIDCDRLNVIRAGEEQKAVGRGQPLSTRRQQSSAHGQDGNVSDGNAHQTTQIKTHITLTDSACTHTRTEKFLKASIQVLYILIFKCPYERTILRTWCLSPAPQSHN